MYAQCYKNKIKNTYIDICTYVYVCMLRKKLLLNINSSRIILFKFSAQNARKFLNVGYAIMIK